MVTAILFLVGLFFLYFVPPNLSAMWYASFPHPWFWVTAITSMLSHANFPHLMGNFIFGFPYMMKLEAKIPWRRFLYVYIMCGMWGNIVQLALVPFMLFPAQGGIGSSGAIFGVVAWSLLEMRENKWIKYAAMTLLAFFTLNQLLGVYVAVTSWAGVGYGAHLGGILRGTWEAKGPALKKWASKRAARCGRSLRRMLKSLRRQP